LTDDHHSIVEQHLERINVYKDQLEIRISLADESGSEIIRVPWAPKPVGRKRHNLAQDSAERLPEIRPADADTPDYN
jgi:hypothetical protein